MRIVNCEQGTDEWFAARLGCPSGSGFSKLITATGKPSTSADSYINQLIAERLMNRTSETYSNEWMERGKELEPEARAYYELYTDNHVREVGFCKHDFYECGVSPDGLVGVDGGLEIKCPSPAVHVKYLRYDRIPSEYKAQVMGCLWITGREWWDFVSFHPAMPVLITRVYRDDPYIELLASEVEKACAVIAKQVSKLEKLK